MPRGRPTPPFDFTQRRWQQVIDSIQDAVIIDDVLGRVVYANKVFLELFGLKPGDLEDLVLEDYVAPEWRQKLRDRHDARIRGESVPAFFEYEGQKSSGERMWLQVSVLEVYDDDGKLFGTQSAIRDITAHKRAQEALRDTYGLFEKAQDAIVVFDPRTQDVLDVNTAATKLYARSWAELAASPVTRLFKVPEQSLEALARALDEEPARPFRDRHVDVNGTERIVEVTACRTQYLGRDAVLSINRDITERARLQEQLFRAQKMEALGELSGSVAHELNNALAAILSNAELLQTELTELREDTGLADEIESVAQKAGQLTRQLLEFSRRQHGQPVVTSLHEVLTGVISMLSRLMPERIALELETNAQRDAVCVDPVQIQELVTSLVLNARDAIVERGTIRVTTENPDPVPSSATSAPRSRSTRFVTISVRDTGQGMEADVLAQVFEPFFTTRPAGMGTGLGLSSAQALARQNSGEIRAESAPGDGSTFTVFLPLYELSLTIPAPTGSTTARGGTRTLLLVDDDLAVLRATTRILEGAGWVVRAASNADQGKRLFREDPAVDLVILDVLMPGQSGPDLGRDLRAERPDLPILFLSGFVPNDIKLSGLDGSEFLAKPYTAVTLRDKVREMLDQ